MPWADYFWRRPPDAEDEVKTAEQTKPEARKPPPSDFSLDIRANTWTYNTTNVLVPTLVLTSLSLLGVRFYTRNLRRIPTAAHLPPRIFRKRSIYGYVSSVGDGDNFRLFHTPGGRLAGWGIVPWRTQHLRPGKLKTIHVRIAGVDAPELAHFGRPAQPFGAEAMTFLKAAVEGKYVRVYLYRRDQYERVVGTAWVRPAPWPVVRALAGLQSSLARVALSPVEVALRILAEGWRAATGTMSVDVGLAMIRSGMATVYEAKFGSEFGGAEKEALYRAAEKEARDRKVGMWGGGKSELEKEEGKQKSWWAWLKGGKAKTTQLETPREYKNRMKDLEGGNKDAK